MIKLKVMYKLLSPHPLDNSILMSYFIFKAWFRTRARGTRRRTESGGKEERKGEKMKESRKKSRKKSRIIKHINLFLPQLT